VAQSHAWSQQGIFTNGIIRPLQLIDHLQPCYLPCFVSRSPRIGGFLHPSCYAVPGTNNTTKASRQAYYVPTTVFEGDGLIITLSHAAAYYRGRAASHLGQGGIANPVRAFPTQAAAKLFFQNSSPRAVTLPALVPYIRHQLEDLDILQEHDDGLAPSNPITVKGAKVGRTTLMLYPFNGDPYTRSQWSPSPPEDPHIRPINDVPDLIQEDSVSTISTAPTTMTTHSIYSTTEERKRSKDRMTNLRISLLPTSGKPLFWCST
jgi:hypothetical protein